MSVPVTGAFGTGLWAANIQTFAALQGHQGMITEQIINLHHQMTDALTANQGQNAGWANTSKSRGKRWVEPNPTRRQAPIRKPPPPKRKPAK